MIVIGKVVNGELIVIAEVGDGEKQPSPQPTSAERKTAEALAKSINSRKEN